MRRKTLTIMTAKLRQHLLKNICADKKDTHTSDAIDMRPMQTH
jgi:hypothetical protein